MDAGDLKTIPLRIRTHPRLNEAEATPKPDPAAPPPEGTAPPLEGSARNGDESDVLRTRPLRLFQRLQHK